MLESTHKIVLIEVQHLQRRLHHEIPKELQQAYETGGQWHDNPHWDGLMADQEKLSIQLGNLMKNLQSPIYIEHLLRENKFSGEVRVGMCVRLLDITTNKQERLCIVGSLDVQYNPSCQGDDFTSYQAPLSRALLGKKVDDEIEIVLPRGQRKLRILNIQPLKL